MRPPGTIIAQFPLAYGYVSKSGFKSGRYSGRRRGTAVVCTGLTAPGGGTAAEGVVIGQPLFAAGCEGSSNQEEYKILFHNDAFEG